MSVLNKVEKFEMHTTGNSVALQIKGNFRGYLTIETMEAILALVKSGAWENTIEKYRAVLPSEAERKGRKIDAKVEALLAKKAALAE